MTGGFGRPKKDKMMKISSGQLVKTGQILVRNMSTYKAGKNVKGINTLTALCDGVVNFCKKKTPHSRKRTFISVLPKK